MTDSTKYLFLLTIGPVQSFIAQARKTQDLNSGSKILSQLVKAAIQKIPNWEKNVIFPVLDLKDTNQSLPNRLVTIIEQPKNELAKIGKETENAIRHEFQKMADKSLGDNKKPDGFDTQINRHLDIHWVFHPLGSDYKKSYKEIEGLLGSIKNVRPFDQFGNGQGEAGRKCSLDGENNALFFGKGTNSRFYSKKWNPQAIALKNSNIIIAPNEGLSAVSFVKRLYKIKSFPSTAKIAIGVNIEQLKENADAKMYFNCFHHFLGKDFDEQLYFEENLNETYFKKNGLKNHIETLPEIKNKHYKIKEFLKTKYYALIMFDGDKMGQWLSDNASLDFHPQFSKYLATFAKKARQIVDNHHGQTVYAGGDDFLGFVNLHTLFEVMIKLRLAFDEEINAKLTQVEKLTFSAGIVIAHYKTPLGEVLKTVRKVEKKAKNEGGRNAFCITAMKHSGEIQEAVFKWGNSENSNEYWAAIQHITQQLSEGVFSSKFISNLTVELYQLAGINIGKINIQDKALFVEFKRLVTRALIQKKDHLTNQKNINTLANKLELLFKNSSKAEEKTKNFIHALHIADFLSRKTN